MKLSIVVPVRSIVFGVVTFVVFYGCGRQSESPVIESATSTTQGLSTRGSSVVTFLSADELAIKPISIGEEEEEEEEDEGLQVAEGDIYRVLDNGILLNLNRYRGLQVIDIRDPSRPRLIGQLRVNGSPLEMHIVSGHAILLINKWYEYQHVDYSGGLGVEPQGGAAVVLVDLADLARPRAISRNLMPGSLDTSRLVTRGNRHSLYVAGSEWGWFEDEGGQLVWSQRTHVKSFELVSPTLVERSSIDLGDDVSAVHAEDDVLLVARHNGSQDNGEVSLVDISSPDGSMIARGSMEVAGAVRSQFHMDMHGHIVRIFSGPRWSAGTPNHLQTWDASDMDSPVPIDIEAFGSGEFVYGAIFLEDRAFAVTYRQVDPFHAFSITDKGEVVETSEFLVSGWNDFFRSVFGATRLIGIGVDDEKGRKLTVSLYDITDLTNSSPLLSRAQATGGSWDWSEATWDHRAFTILEDAVQIPSPIGEVETGLVLLPFTSRYTGEGSSKVIVAVQLFTFSSTTLTERGIMVHGTDVRRTFPLDGELAANLSDEELSLFDNSDVHNPQEVSRLTLASHFLRFFSYGDFRVRVSHSGWTGADPVAKVEMISSWGPVEIVEPYASFTVPYQAQFFQVGRRLITSVGRVVDYLPSEYETTIDVYDLDNPHAPEHVGTLTTTELPPGSGYRWQSRRLPTAYVAGDALVYLRPIAQSSTMGIAHDCHTSLPEVVDCFGEEGCTYWAGQKACRQVGDEEYCVGGFARCTDHLDSDTTCEPADPAGHDVPIDTFCDTTKARRNWLQFEMDVVDVRQGADPRVVARLTLPADAEGVSLLADGSTLYVTTKLPAVVDDDPRPYVRYFLTPIDLSDPALPVVGPQINVPGELLTIDGSELYTRDPVWGDSYQEVAVARLRLSDDRAYLKNYHRFANRSMEAVPIQIDDRGLVVAHHRQVWVPYLAYRGWLAKRRLTVLGPRPCCHAAQPGELTHGWAGVGSFELLSDTCTGPNMYLTHVAARRALLSVTGGKLMVDLRRPRRPRTQAFLRVFGSPYEVLVDHRKLLMPTGIYGIYEWPLWAENLEPDSRLSKERETHKMRRTQHLALPHGHRTGYTSPFR